ncbi:hypothetical protein CLAIMM_00607 [Cladophialophora immunda]|nr:hypothetical protein CLAIMM_00607 [Cladophialophora immunda]
MEGAEAQPSKEKKGLKTVWNRIKDLFREKPAAAQDPLSATTPPSVSAAPVAPQTEEAVDTTKPGPPIEHSPEQPADETAEEPEQPSEPVSTSPQEPVDPKQDSTAESHMRFTKAQAIFARHNLELDETEWEPRYRVPQERVYKNIRYAWDVNTDVVLDAHGTRQRKTGRNTRKTRQPLGPRNSSLTSLDQVLKVERAMNVRVVSRLTLKNVPTATTEFARDACTKPPSLLNRAMKPPRKQLKRRQRSNNLNNGSPLYKNHPLSASIGDYLPLAPLSC